MNDEILKELKYNSALVEEVRSQNKAILEGLQDVPKRAEFNELRQDVAELKQNMRAVKAAVSATNHDLKQHKNLPARVAHGRA